jgi:hypothetical protein
MVIGSLLSVQVITRGGTAADYTHHLLVHLSSRYFTLLHLTNKA